MTGEENEEKRSWKIKSRQTERVQRNLSRLHSFQGLCCKNKISYRKLSESDDSLFSDMMMREKRWDTETRSPCHHRSVRLILILWFSSGDSLLRGSSFQSEILKCNLCFLYLLLFSILKVSSKDSFHSTKRIKFTTHLILSPMLDLKTKECFKERDEKVRFLLLVLRSTVENDDTSKYEIIADAQE